MTPEIALQDALVAILEAVPEVAALGAGKVNDEVPADRARPPAPYVYLGPIGSARYEAGCATAWTVRARVFVTTTDFGRVTAWELAHAARRAIEGAEPALPAGFGLVGPLRVVQAGDVLESNKSVFLDAVGVVQEV